MSEVELPVIFAGAGARLVGILHAVTTAANRGVLIIVGGPQYRVGSHRQFLLMARFLAARGVPAMRFDCRGMGDSDGSAPGFQRLDADIRAAIDEFTRLQPGLEEVVLWGLCDAASAALLYSRSDARVAGLVLLNPWVRSSGSRVYLRHYYARRLFDPGLWRAVLAGRLDVRAGLRSFVTELRKALAAAARPGAAGDTFVGRMQAGLRDFTGPVLFILSGDDLTAAEFNDTVRASRAWRKLMRGTRISSHWLKKANHTFSKQVWRGEVELRTLDWLRSW